MFRKLHKMFQSILRLEDSAQSIALGTAIGLFIAWTPTVSIHMILVVAIAMLLRANKVAGLIAVYISNPITMLPMYWIEYRLGAFVSDNELTYDELRSILDFHGWDGFKAALWKLCVDFAGPMWLGGLVLATAHAVPGYYLTRWAVERFRRKNPDKVTVSATPAIVAPSTATPAASNDTRPIPVDDHVPPIDSHPAPKTTGPTS
jgi:uncharacterized protein (TIGR03546 family)